jgi:hypothetical protein
VEVGLLWFDDSKRKTLETKVNEAKAAYCAKPRFAGQTPDVCYVHPSMLQEEQNSIQLNGVRITAAATILPHHLFIGVESAGDNGRDRPRKKRRRSTKSKR